MEKKTKKSPWRFLFLACTAYGGLHLLSGVLMYAFVWFTAAKNYATSSRALSIGIIGGADGPTAIFVTTPAWTSYVPPVLLLTVGICGLVWLRKKQRNEE